MLEPLVTALDHEQSYIREAVVLELGQLKDHTAVELVVAALGDSEQRVREAAIQVLHQLHPEALPTVVREAIAIVQRGEPGKVLGSMLQRVVADAIGNVGHNSPALLEKLTQLLEWPYWEVRIKAA